MTIDYADDSTYPNEVSVEHAVDSTYLNEMSVEHMDDRLTYVIGQ